MNELIKERIIAELFPDIRVNEIRLKYKSNFIYHGNICGTLCDWGSTGWMFSRGSITVYINWYWSGYEVRWCVGKKLHRDGAPASVIFERCPDNTLKISREEYYKYNKLHRMDGPASIEYTQSAPVELWFINDQELTAAEVEKILRPDDIMAAIWTLPQPIAEEIAVVFRAV